MVPPTQDQILHPPRIFWKSPINHEIQDSAQKATPLSWQKHPLQNKVVLLEYEETFFERQDFFFISGDKGKENIRLFLKYDYNGMPVIENIKRISRPGLRVYVAAGEAPRVLDGLGVSILSTSKGVLSNKKAKQLGVGGELICEVY